jgi:hypothetical protein
MEGSGRLSCCDRSPDVAGMRAGGAPGQAGESADDFAAIETARSYGVAAVATGSFQRRYWGEFGQRSKHGQVP